VAYARAYIGVAFGQSGNAAALAPLEAALEWFRNARDLYGLRLSLVVLSTYHLIRGDLDRALGEAEEAARIAREFGLDRELAIALQVLATVVLTTGDLPRAAELFRETLAALRRDPSPFWAARALLLLGVVTCRLGDPVLGARFLGAAESCRGTIGADLFPHDRERLSPVVTAGRDAAGLDAFDQAWAEGRALSVEDASALALSGAADAGTPGPEGSVTATPIVSQRAWLPLEVHALGPLRISVDGVPLQPDAWRYLRPRELLLYLLAAPEGYTRDQIGLTFWPDSSATQVKNSFHVTLPHLRRALGRADLIEFQDDRYRLAWNQGVWVDAREFEVTVETALKTLGVRHGRRSASDLVRKSTSVESAQPADRSAVLDELRAALDLYRGEFLADERAGDWHLEYRDRLRRLYTRGTLLTAAELQINERHAEAAEAYRRVLAADELHEEAHRRLMIALARGGERSSALRQYERLSLMLRKELSAQPESETTMLYDRIRGTEPV
jgi:DNA-binding SARP family transcriptional activator